MRLRSELSEGIITEADQRMAGIGNVLAHLVRVVLVRYLTQKNCGQVVDNEYL